MRRIGVFGGSFDPPHRAHFLLVQCAFQTLDLDEVIVIPAALPPHKLEREQASFTDRLNMTRLLFSDLKKVSISDMEAHRQGPSYTFDTLQQIQEEHPDDDLYLLTGGDAYQTFSTWYQWEGILDVATLVIFHRPGYPSRGNMALEKAAALSKKGLMILHRLNLDISSTELRHRLYRGEQADKIDQEVMEYIVAGDLYRSADMSYFHDIIQKQLPEKRYQHSLRVAEMAITLAKAHHANVIQAEIAGLMHDYAKYVPKESLLQEAEKAGLITDVSEYKAIYLLHGPVGAQLLYEQGIVNDQEVLKAIASHTVGHPGMSDLEKIVFLADYLEPGRKTPHIKEIFEVALKDLNQGLRMALDQTIQYLVSQGQPIHPDAIRCRNECLLKESICGKNE